MNADYTKRLKKNLSQAAYTIHDRAWQATAGLPRPSRGNEYIKLCKTLMTNPEFRLFEELAAGKDFSGQFRD